MFERAHKKRQEGTDDFFPLSQEPLGGEKSSDFHSSDGRHAIKGDRLQNSEETLFRDYSSLGGDGRLFGRRMPKPLHWSIPWSDLMMTMFIFFAILFTYHAAIKEVPSNENLLEEAGLRDMEKASHLVSVSKAIRTPFEDLIKAL